MSRAMCAALLVLLWGCSNAAPGVPTASSSTSDVVLLQGTGTFAFPPSAGYMPSAAYSIAGNLVTGTSVSLTTLPAGAGTTPKPTGNAIALVAMQLTTTAPFVLSQFPLWSMTVPSGVSANTPVGFEVFDGSSSLAEYAASISGGQVQSVAFGANFSVATGHTYTFILEQNPVLNQMPH